MTLLAAGIAFLGYLSPKTVPICFAPETTTETKVVCPTGQMILTKKPNQDTPLDIDNAVAKTVYRGDLFLIETIGLTAAAVAAAAAIRRIRGASEPYGLPLALAALKLPTGAMTAFLGLLLMRGQFVPGLSALDTSAQILAWALVFGYAQQLFTRLVDHQAHSVSTIQARSRLVNLILAGTRLRRREHRTGVACTGSSGSGRAHSVEMAGPSPDL